MSKKVALNIISAAKIYAPTQIEDLDEKRIVPQMMIRRRLTRNAKIMLYIADKCGFTGGKIVYASAFGEPPSLRQGSSEAKRWITKSSMKIT